MITFRRAKEGDIEIIRSIAFKTWPQTYNHIVGEEQVTYMLDKLYNKGELLEQLMNGQVFLIAEDGSLDVGFAGFSEAEGIEKAWKLHKLYVLPEMHGKGTGKIMINEVVNQAKRSGAELLVLNVNKNNPAKIFYERAGFTVRESVKIAIGNGYFMDDFVMELKL